MAQVEVINLEVDSQAALGAGSQAAQGADSQAAPGVDSQGVQAAFQVVQADFLEGALVEKVKDMSTVATFSVMRSHTFRFLRMDTTTSTRMDTSISSTTTTLLRIT